MHLLGITYARHCSKKTKTQKKGKNSCPHGTPPIFEILIIKYFDIFLKKRQDIKKAVRVFLSLSSRAIAGFPCLKLEDYIKGAVMDKKGSG
jgi:hypothetical protein